MKPGNRLFRYGAKSCRINSWKMRGDNKNEPSLEKEGFIYI